MAFYSAILWEEEVNQNQIIGVNVQAAQSLSMAISPHCVAQLSSTEALSLFGSQNPETNDGPVRARLLELDLSLQPVHAS